MKTGKNWSLKRNLYSRVKLTQFLLSVRLRDSLLDSLASPDSDVEDSFSKVAKLSVSSTLEIAKKIFFKPPKRYIIRCIKIFR